VNNSGVAQAFVSGNTSAIHFTNSATAGDLTSFTVVPGDITVFGAVHFSDDSNAGSADITNQSTDVQFDFGNGTLFDGHSSAANATIINAGGAEFGGRGFTFFLDSSDAGNATIMSEPGFNGITAGQTLLSESSSAGNATLIAFGAERASEMGGMTIISGSTSSGIATAANARLIAYGNKLGHHSFGTIVFEGLADGGTAHVEVYGDGTLDVTQHDPPGLTIGSLSGDGLVALGDVNTNLTIGKGGFDSKFDGRISGGSVTKVGGGTLMLTQPNSYSNETVIKAGNLVVRNRTGSATGTGPVQVLGGTLAGDGIISGAVNVVGSSHTAFLSAGTSVKHPGVLTIQNLLTFGTRGTYKCTLDSNSSVAAKVVAGGVSINGALISLVDVGNTILAPGTAFTVIDNTGLGPISGAFSNLPEGATITVGSNTFQAGYEDGDGNDLRLTVVP
jgi:autotransporter-associated beta strand protein